MRSRAVAGLVCLLLVSATNFGQGPADEGTPARVSFQFAWPARDATTYSIVIDAGGTGSFTGSLIEQTHPVNVAFAFRLSKEATGKAFEGAKALNRFAVPCAAKMKGIADTGTKVLSYKGPEGTGSCTYNYTENKTVQGLTELFEGMKATVVAGRKLEFDHRFDRLALFEDMKALTNEVKAGRAMEMGTIAGTLRSIAEDPEVLEKVRDEAVTLLKTVNGAA